MAIECAYSFTDLYKAAYGKEPEDGLLKKFDALSQSERNTLVNKWASKAGWETKQRIGSDGVEYVAFAPKF